MPPSPSAAPLLPSATALLARQAPGPFASTNTANPDAIIIPAGLVGPLPRFNTWFFAFLAVIFLVSVPLLIGISLLAHRWRTDWRHRPERLLGDRAWEVEVFGCDACGREPTSLFKDPESGLGILFADAKDIKSNQDPRTDGYEVAPSYEEQPAAGPSTSKPAQYITTHNSLHETGRVRVDFSGFEEIELTDLTFSPTGLVSAHPPNPSKHSLVPDSPTLPAPAQTRRKAKPLQLELKGVHFADPMECQLSSTKSANRASWRRSMVGLPAEGVPSSGWEELGVCRPERRSIRRSLRGGVVG